MVRNLFPPAHQTGEVQDRRFRLFAVDDDEFVRTSLARRLRKEGFDVREFESGEAMISALDQGAILPDAIIMDYNMMGLNGVEITKLFRQRSSSVPVILLSAYTGVIDKEQVQRLGVTRILTKTIDLECVPEVIVETIQQRQP
jgi:CheY-like chemotaxis protein